MVEYGTQTILFCVYRSYNSFLFHYFATLKRPVSDPCQHVIRVPEDSKDCHAAGVQTWRSRWRGRSHFYTSTLDARFHTPASCGGALKKQMTRTHKELQKGVFRYFDEHLVKKKK